MNFEYFNMELSNGKSQLYLSFDVETDGPTPMINNLLSIGIVGLDVNYVIRYKFEANIEPFFTHVPDKKTMETFWLLPEQEKAWAYLQTNKQNYVFVFERIGRELKQLEAEYTLVFVAQPACFDWMFFKCYYENARANSDTPYDFYDIGYSCVCASTLWKNYKAVNNISSKESIVLQKQMSTIPEQILADFSNYCEHCAIYDALKQGFFFVSLLKNFGLNKY